MKIRCAALGLLLSTAALAAGNPAPAYQPAHYDLSALPSYEKLQRVTGVLRIYGTPLEDLVGKWANAFRTYHAQVRLQAYLINTSQAFAGLVTGSADIGLMGHRQWRNGFEAFRKQFGYDPLEIRFASGSYDDPAGTTPGLMFIVNKRNPLAGLTLAQLDGIYGAQRTGGWVNGQWSTAVARGPEKNIRTWGQLDVTGELADQPIKLYGSDVTLSNWADLMEREAFQGGTKWNPALNEAPRADIGTKAKGKTRDQQILEAVENDPTAIGFIFQRVINANHGDVRVLPLAARADGRFVAPSAGAFFDGSYPLHNGAYIYLNRVPGQPLGNREKEFVRFLLSREGQQIIADDRLFIPLNADQIKVELAKLE
ncbi:MAG: Phosphate transport system substrate-binding protein [Lacunisphaera sp.]|nr:Phosphate transport system substrate-binding protein [Lacunisphaera sp.]